MALPKSLKRKINGENCSFNEEWTDKYVFVMPTFLDVSFTMKVLPSQIKQQLSSPVAEKLPH